jgi:MFS family permease
MSEGAERAIISEYAAPRERGTAFGWYHLMVGIAAIPAGLLFGSIWQFQSAAMAFFIAGALAAFAALLLRMWAWPVRKLRESEG